MLSRLPSLLLLIASGVAVAQNDEAAGPAAADPAAPAVPSLAPAPSEPAASSPAASSPAAPSPAAPVPSAPATPVPDVASGDADPAPDASSSSSTAVPSAAATRRVGDPVPLTLREPTLRAQSVMVGLRYGLVGTGPTRFVDDIRYSLTDHIELRTALLPWPTALLVRGRIGSQQGDLGAFLIDGGLAYFDAGIRVVPDTGEANVGVRAHLEASVGWTKRVVDRTAVAIFARYRERLSMLADDEQRAVAVDAHVTHDLLDTLAVAAGLGFASTVGTTVREVVVNFVETDRPGISHLLARDDGGQQSVTIPLSLTYGRVDAFDVDLFCTTRVWPTPGVLFGAGVRLRFEPLPWVKS
jgi:hypothetical protein